jgi:hypothetical protein
MRILTFLGLLTVTFTLTAQLSLAKDISNKELFIGYISIQEALAADDLGTAQSKAKQLQSEIQNLQSKDFKDLKGLLATFVSSKTISDARKEFKKLSMPFVDWMGRNKDAELEVVQCPMYSAKWVQKRGDIANPFYGKEMLKCGEKI